MDPTISKVQHHNFISITNFNEQYFLAASLVAKHINAYLFIYSFLTMCITKHIVKRRVNKKLQSLEITLKDTKHKIQLYNYNYI